MIVAKIFVGGLPPDYSQEKFEEYFKKYGELIEAKIILRNGVSRGFGFVKYVNEHIAAEVVGQIHRIQGQMITVKYSVPTKTASGEQEFCRQKKRFYIGGLGESNKINSKCLVKYFSEWGKVEDAFVVKGRGFGFVTIIFNNRNLIDMLQQIRKHRIKNVDVEVKLALPKKNEIVTESTFRPEQRFDASFRAPACSPSIAKAYGQLYSKSNDWSRQQLSSFPPPPQKPTYISPFAENIPPYEIPLQLKCQIEKSDKPKYQSVGQYESFGATPAETFYQTIPTERKSYMNEPIQINQAPKPNDFHYSFPRACDLQRKSNIENNLGVSTGYSYGTQFGSATRSTRFVSTFNPY